MTKLLLGTLVSIVGLTVPSAYALAPERLELERPPVSTTPVVRPTSSLDREKQSLPTTVQAPADAKCPMWWTVLAQAGWGTAELPYADKIIWRESRCLSAAYNPADPTQIGDLKGSIGLFQINLFWVKGTTYYPMGYLQTMGVVESPEDLFNPVLNARAALAIYRYSEERNGCGWNPWATARGCGKDF